MSLSTFLNLRVLWGFLFSNPRNRILISSLTWPVHRESLPNFAWIFFLLTRVLLRESLSLSIVYLIIFYVTFSFTYNDLRVCYQNFIRLSWFIQGETLFLFYETKNSITMQGDIGVSRSDDQGATWQHLGVALDEEWHLSYPYVFEYRGEVRFQFLKSTSCMAVEFSCVIFSISFLFID